jgi:hypothetical protein
MGQIDVTDAWLYKYMSIVDEAIINEIEKNVDYDYACTDDKEVFQADKGYVQFKVYKSESYVKNETSRASGNVLDSLYEANKVKVVLRSNDYDFSQTLMLPMLLESQSLMMLLLQPEQLIR